MTGHWGDENDKQDNAIAIRPDGRDPPTRLPPPPRQVRASLLGVGRFLHLAPFILIGLYFAYRVAWVLIFTLTYSEIPATLTGGRIDSSQTKPSYYLTYRYSDSGRVFVSEAWVPEEVYQQHHAPGEPTSVRHFSFGPMAGETLTLANQPGSELSFLIPFAAIWTFVVGSRLLDLWRKQRLVRFGQATTGTITRLYYVPGRHGGSTNAEYSFVDPASGAWIAATMQVDRLGSGRQSYEVLTAKGWHWQGSKVDLPLPKQGPAVTVLYDPDNPKRSIVYELCGFEAELAPDGRSVPLSAE